MPFLKARNANYNALRKLNLRERIDAVGDPRMGQTLISMLTPTEAAELFPKYYLERNPNISGFIKAIPSSLSANRQREYEQQIQNTASGSSAGANYDSGGYRRSWQKEMDSQSQRTQVTKRGTPPPPPQLSPEQRSAFEALKAGDIGVNDDRVKFLKNISDADLSRAGLTRVKGDTGERYHYQAPQVSDEDVKKAASGVSKNEFFNSVYQEAYKQAKGQFAHPEVIARLAAVQAAHESAYGRKAPGSNYFGIKGPGQSFATHEEIGGQSVGMNQSFRTYGGLSDSVSGYLSLMKKSRYSRVANAATIEEAIAAQGQTGYATDSNYAQKLFNVNRSNMGGDAITQNYTPQQLEIKKRELLSQIEAGRITELAQITQPGLRAAAQELNINTPADMKQVKSQMAQSSGGFYHSTASTVSATRQECADLSKAFNPNVGPAGGWKVERNDSGIRPGVVVATSRYNDGSGGKHAQGYHTGVAMSGVRPDGTFLLLEQANGMKPRVSVMNVGNYNYNGRHPEIQGNFWAPIKGHENEQSVEALKVGYQIAPSDTERASIQSSLSGGVSDSNVITSNSNRVERTIAGYGNSEQMAQSAGVGLSEKAQVERKAVVQGSLSFEGGGTYHFGSGRPDDPNHPSTPLGSSPVGGLNPHHVPGGVGYEMPALQGWDPKVGRNRDGMVIHSSGHDDLKQLYSHGCISIPKSEFPAFEAEMEAFKRSHGGKAYINVLPDGRVTVTAQPMYGKGGQVMNPEEAIQTIQREQPQVVQQAPQVVSGDIKPLTDVTQPQGPVNAQGPVTPQAAPQAPEAAPQAAPQAPEAAPQAPEQTAKVEPPKPAEAPKPSAPTPERYRVDTEKFVGAIRQTEDFKRQAGMFGSMVPSSTIINGFNDDPRVKAAGVRLDEQGVMHFSKGMTPDVKEVMSTFDTKSFMTKIEDKNKEAPTRVKAMAEGGTIPVNTEKISAYPIDGLRGDNAIVVNAQQKPLFTMNTNENIMMDPDNNRAHVLPDRRDTTISPMNTPDPTSGIAEEFRSSIEEIKRDFANLTPTKIEKVDMGPNDTPLRDKSWVGKLNDGSADPYKNPTIRRVAYRANGMETGEPVSGFHYSHRNNS